MGGIHGWENNAWAISFLMSCMFSSVFVVWLAGWSWRSFVLVFFVLFCFVCPDFFYIDFKRHDDDVDDDDYEACMIQWLLFQSRFCSYCDIKVLS